MNNPYSKTEGHHCWWLNIDGKAVANFDKESDVDAIVGLHCILQEAISQRNGAWLALEELATDHLK